MATLWQSLRYTLRVLAKNPGFTTAAVLSLALGIGANTAIFTLINALLLRDLPVRQPQRLVYLSAVRQGSKITFSYPMFRELERGQRVFSGMIGWGGNWMPNVEVNGVLSQDRVLSVTANCYSELGASSLLGRLLNPEDENLSGGANSQVAVIGYEFWQRRFGGTRDVVGKQIDRKSTRLNSSHLVISYAVFCLKKKRLDGPTGNEVARHRRRYLNRPGCGIQVVP